MKTDRQTDT